MLLLDAAGTVAFHDAGGFRAGAARSLAAALARGNADGAGRA